MSKKHNHTEEEENKCMSCSEDYDEKECDDCCDCDHCDDCCDCDDCDDCNDCDDCDDACEHHCNCCHDDEEDFDECDDDEEDDDHEFDEWWENFYKVKGEEQVSLAKEIIEKGSDSESFIDFLYELLEEMNHTFRVDGKKAEWYALCEHLQSFQPEMYAELLTTILYYNLTFEINDKNWDKVSGLLDDFVKSLSEAPMYYQEIEEMLLYANQLGLVRKFVEGLRAKIQNFEDWDSEAMDEMEERASHYLIFEHLEKNEIDRNQIFKELEDYGEFEESWVDDFLYYLTRKIQRTWTPSDFLMPKKLKNQKGKGKKRAPKISEEEKLKIRKNFYHLALEFIGYLHHVKGVSYMQAEVASYEIIECLLQNQIGLFTEKQLSKQVIESDIPLSCELIDTLKVAIDNLKKEPLSGDFATLYLNMIAVSSYILSLEDSIYPCALFTEYLKDWMDFCVAKGFCPAETKDKIIQSMKGVPLVFKSLCRSTQDVYPGLQEDVEKKWNE